MLPMPVRPDPGVEQRHSSGRHAIVPGGPAALALKTGAALMSANQYVTGPGRLHIHVDPVIAVQEAETKEHLMQRLIDRFQDFIRERPDQWYAFRPMFRAEE